MILYGINLNPTVDFILIDVKLMGVSHSREVGMGDRFGWVIEGSTLDRYANGVYNKVGR